MSQFENPYYSGGGGGFVPGGSPYGSQGGSPGGSGRRENQGALRAVLTRQLTNATQTNAGGGAAEWMLENVELSQHITVVGHVASAKEQTTNNIYTIEDCHGQIEARHWIDAANPEDTEKWDKIEILDVVRVTGTLKNFGDKRYINATHIRKLDKNDGPQEIAHHFLEVVYGTLVQDRGPPARGGQGQNDATMGNGTSASSAYTIQSHGGANDQYAHLQPLQRQIVQFLRTQSAGDDGIHVAAIIRGLGNKTGLDAHTINEALDSLMEDGLVFTTIDETHFKLTE